MSNTQPTGDFLELKWREYLTLGVQLGKIREPAAFRRYQERQGVRDPDETGDRWWLDRNQPKPETPQEPRERHEIVADASAEWRARNRAERAQAATSDEWRAIVAQYRDRVRARKAAES